MSLTGITSSALTALQTNSTALRVVSDNVANLNTQGYTRRVVEQTPLTAGGQLAGVDIASIQRVVDRFLTQENLSAGGGAAQFDAQSSVFKELNGLLGQPGDGTALTTRLDNISAALGQAALAPTAATSQLGTLNALQGFASGVSSLAQSISGLRDQVDRQVTASIAGANDLIKQIHDLNAQIQTATAAGDTATSLLDQRDLAVQNLTQIVGVRTVQQPNGTLAVLTEDGIGLVGDSYAQLSYTGGSNNGAYGSIAIQNLNGASGLPIGPSQPLDPHLGSGKLKGLIDVRDGALGDLQQELGNFARTTALAFNAQHNANAAFPPPSSLAGRNTGLVGTDGLNFTGKSAIAVTDANGKLVGNVAIDFGAGTISVNGGATASFGGTLGDFVSTLDSSLSSLGGSASFADGRLSLQAGGSNGLVVQDDPTAPASRGGSGFSQFFGLNDLFQSAAPSIRSTGLSGSDASGLAAGGQIDLQLKGPNGDIAKTASVSITAGSTIGNVVAALNSALGGAASFTLNADGSIAQATAPAYAGYRLNVTGDSTARGTTGISFTQLFGLGTGQTAAQAQGFAVASAIAAAPQRLAFATPAENIATAAVGDTIVGHGDASGAQALQNIGTAQQTFAKAGAFGAQTVTLGSYAASLYQDVATRTQAAQANQTTQDDRLKEAQARQASNSGVNLDEELTKMLSYQQAYSAGARLLTVVDQLYTTLLQVQ